MRFTFLTWNINARTMTQKPHLLHAYIPFLRSPFSRRMPPSFVDIIALQEVKPALYNFLKGSSADGKKNFAHHYFSLEEAGVKRDRGVVILVSNKFKVMNHGVLNFPEDIECGEKFEASTCVLNLWSKETGDFTVASFHIPNGSQYGKGNDRRGRQKGEFKRRFGDRVGMWIAEQKKPVIFGVDANSPRLDHLDPNKVSLFDSDSRRMFGPARLHQARDAYRDYRALHPDEPWAFTHKGYRSKPVRFDQIWVTNEVKIGRVRTGVMQICPSFNPGKLWLLDETGTEAISDHAWVAAELSI